MVSIKFIFDRVADLSIKDKAGYMSSEQFNRDLSQAQDLLFEFYYQQYERSQIIVDSLTPFLKEVEIPIISGYCEKPADYRHRLEVAYKLVLNSDACGGGEPSVDEIEMYYLNSNEERETLMSAIRKPSLQDKVLYHLFVNGKIKIHPKDLVGSILFKYFSQPPQALYAVTLDVVNDQENFDPVNSVDTIWYPQDAHHLVDIMLFFKGIQIRESALIEWIVQKQKFSQTT